MLMWYDRNNWKKTKVALRAALKGRKEFLV